MALTTGNAKTKGIVAHYDPCWLKVPEQPVPAGKHPEEWPGLEVFLQAQRDAVTKVINNAIAVTSVGGLPYAQDLALYGRDLAEERRQPHAGSLFPYRPGVAGLLPFAYQG
jgi:hypothetical protein